MRIENSFVLAPGVGERTERRLWEHGVTHWDEFAGCDVVGDRTAEKVSAFIETARPHLDERNAGFFGDHLPNKSLWRVYENFRERTCFFDIETTGLSKDRNDVTTVSLHRGGETTTLVRGRDLTSEALAREFDAADVLVSFNGKRFDAPFLEHDFDVDLSQPHIDLMYPCRRLGLTGGLKQIESDLGIGRGGVDVDGREAVRLWHRYERDGDEDALDRLVRYNRYDTENLRTLLERVHGSLRADVFDPYCTRA